MVDWKEERNKIDDEIGLFSAIFFLNPTYPKVYTSAGILQTFRQYHICILGYQFCSYFGNYSANTAL